MDTTKDDLSRAIQDHQAGRLAEAEASYREILKSQPDHPDAWHLLGVISHQRGNNATAVEQIERAIQLRGNQAHYHNNLGLAYYGLNNRPQAVACYQQALQLNPTFSEAYNNLGNVLLDQRQLSEAVACYERAIQLRPNYAEAFGNLGLVWKEQRKPQEAIASFQRAIELKPSHAEAHNNLGATLHDLGHLDQAVACYRRALQLNSNYALALAALIHALQQTCQWEDLESLSRRVIDLVDHATDARSAAVVSPFTFLCLATPTTPEQQLRCARNWVERQQAATRQEPGESIHRKPDSSSRRKPKLTIGYLSSDFHAHATAYLIAELFEKHDRTRFFIHGYSYGIDDASPMRQRLRDGVDRFVDLKLSSFTEAADRIASDDVDILVDLKGYMANSRSQILALRPAPIQVNYLGYPGTMGASFMDYVLVDEFLAPADQQPFFTEKLVHLPGSYQVNDSRREIEAKTPTRATSGLPDMGFVFCNFNHSYKITPAMFDVWMELLKAVPGSVLWLLEGNRFARSNLYREAENRGVDRQRLVFAPHRPLAEHLARYRLADLFLDTFPVNSHTTASDALWGGCPVLTLAGETFVSRVAGSLLQAIGLPDLITTSLGEYQHLALELAQDPAQLARIRSRLETNRETSTLFDAAAFARNLEQAYESMWAIHASGEKPRAFCVHPDRPFS